jgi:hypothetical protein
MSDTALDLEGLKLSNLGVEPIGFATSAEHLNVGEFVLECWREGRDTALTSFLWQVSHVCNFCLFIYSFMYLFFAAQIFLKTMSCCLTMTFWSACSADFKVNFQM